MLLCSINEPETVADRLALMSQRDNESRAQTEYQRARKLLLHAVHLSCATKPSCGILRRVESEDGCRASSKSHTSVNAVLMEQEVQSGGDAAKVRYIDDPSLLRNRLRGREILFRRPNHTGD